MLVSKNECPGSYVHLLNMRKGTQNFFRRPRWWTPECGIIMMTAFSAYSPIKHKLKNIWTVIGLGCWRDGNSADCTINRVSITILILPPSTQLIRSLFSCWSHWDVDLDMNPPCGPSSSRRLHKSHLRVLSPPLFSAVMWYWSTNEMRACLDAARSSGSPAP